MTIENENEDKMSSFIPVQIHRSFQPGLPEGVQQTFGIIS